MTTSARVDTMSRTTTSKGSVHKLVRKAIRNGDLVQQPCEVCGDENSVAHHEDYDKPLEVRWFCRKHHFKRHRELKKEMRTVRLDTLLKPNQMAARAGVTPRTIVRWIHEGKLRGVKVGRVWRVRAEDWKEFVDGEPQSEQD